MIVFEEYLKKRNKQVLVTFPGLYSLDLFNINKSYKLVSNGEQTLQLYYLKDHS